MDSGLDPFFRPRAIAIVSEDFSKINGRPLKFLLDKGYSGRIYPVNPKYDSAGCEGGRLPTWTRSSTSSWLSPASAWTPRG